MTSDAKWLLLMCASRACFSLIFTAYAAVIPLVQPEWGMSSSATGLVQSAWHIGYLISLFGAGLLVDRVGARDTYLATGLAACASALLFALLANSFLSALVLHFVAGLFSGGSYAPGLALIALRYGTATRGWAMGCFLAAASLGYGVCLLGSGLIIPAWGWRAALLFSAAATVAGAFLGWVALRSTPNISAGPIRPQSWTAAARTLWRNEPAKLAVGAYTLHAWELLGLWAWLPAFLVVAAQAQGEGASSGVLTAGITLAGVTHLVSIAASLAGGALSDRVGRARVILIMSCASIACSFAFGWLVGFAMWIVVLVAVVYSFTAIGDSAVFSTVLTEVVPREYIGVALSIRSVLGFGAGAVSPWVFGLTLDLTAPSSGAPGALTWGIAWCTLGAGALLGPLMTLRLQRLREYRPPRSDR
ncbi:MAG TPA: MFS transporter [Burkholderiales bacterium]